MNIKHNSPGGPIDFTFHFENNTRGTEATVTVPVDPPIHMALTTAEWVVERPTVNGQLAILPHFDPMYMTQAFWGPGGAYDGQYFETPIAASTLLDVDMVNSQGAVLSTAVEPLSAAGEPVKGAIQFTWHAPQ